MSFQKLVTVVCNDFDCRFEIFSNSRFSVERILFTLSCSALANCSEQYTIKQQQQQQNQTKIRNSLTCTHLNSKSVSMQFCACTIQNPNNAKWYYFIMRTVLLHAEKILFMYFNHQVGVEEWGGSHNSSSTHEPGGLQHREGWYNKPFRQQWQTKRKKRRIKRVIVIKNVFIHGMSIKYIYYTYNT